MDDKGAELMSLEARVARLEESLWFQERHISGLDETALALDKRLALIERRLEQAREMIISVREALEARSAAGPANEPPPHYQQGK